jgi:ABC-type Fe3+-hydroxamate transport system substrate-binding protein
MPSFTDQLGRIVTLNHPPTRIISLVPSQTELLYSLGVNVVGITKFCVHPENWFFREKPRIGGTKDIHPEKIAALQPDLIIANKEENDREQIESLAASYPVWVSDIKTLADALAMIRAVGELVGRSLQGQALADQIQNKFDGLSLTPAHSPHTAYLIWRNPYMAAGSDTFIDDMLRRCGLSNVFAGQDRYPVTNPSVLAASGCELVLLSSEPYPFRGKHMEELQSLLPNATIRLVDGELFSWYGSRLLLAPAYFQDLIRNLTPLLKSRE